MKLIVFHQPHLSSRGTSVAMYDYADYNETLLGNTSIILYQDNHESTHPLTEEKFNKRFKCYKYTHSSQIDLLLTMIGCDDNSVIYHIKYGHNDGLLSKKYKNAIHAVFIYSPHGYSPRDKYALVSEYLAKKYIRTNFYEGYYVPHIVRPFVKPSSNFREVLNIPNNAIVIGRYGGDTTFSIDYVKKCIIEYVINHPNYYFIFMSTNKFSNHPNIIYMDTTFDLEIKSKFIDTCDAMIHARIDGETFGCSVAEFSVANKPIITTKSGDLCHIDILGDEAILYNDEQSLINIFDNITTIINSKPHRNGYSDFYPEKVMNIFNNVFLS